MSKTTQLKKDNNKDKTEKKEPNKIMVLKTDEQIRLENIYVDIIQQYEYYKQQVAICNNIITNYGKLINILDEKAEKETNEQKKLQLLIDADENRLLQAGISVRKISSMDYVNTYAVRINNHNTTVDNLAFEAKKQYKDMLKKAKNLLKLSTLPQEQRKKLKNSIKLFDKKFENDRRRGYAYKSLSMEVQTAYSIIEAKRKTAPPNQEGF